MISMRRLREWSDRLETTTFVVIGAWIAVGGYIRLRKEMRQTADNTAKNRIERHEWHEHYLEEDR